MCDSNMEYKTRSLFISIALSFLLGCLFNANFFTTEAVETPFGTLAETIYSNDYSLDSEKASISEYGLISEINEGNALRHFPQNKRINNSSTSKLGLDFTKRNHILYTSPLTIQSCKSFPSGLTEAKQYLISLGKLII